MVNMRPAPRSTSSDIKVRIHYISFHLVPPYSLIFRKPALPAVFEALFGPGDDARAWHKMVVSRKIRR